MNKARCRITREPDGFLRVEEWTDPPVVFDVRSRPVVIDLGEPWVDLPQNLLRQYKIAMAMLREADRRIEEYLEEEKRREEHKAATMSPEEAKALLYTFDVNLHRAYKDCGCYIDDMGVELCDTHHAIQEAESD